MEHVSSVRPTGKFPGKLENLKGGPVFPVGISERNFVFYLHVSRSLYQFQVHGKKICWAPRRTGVYDQMEKLFTNRKFHFCFHRNFRFFFPKWKVPLVSCYAYGDLNKLPWSPRGSRNLPQGTCDICYQL